MTTRYVVYLVGACLLLAVGGIIYLASNNGGQPIPDVLQNIAVGSLTGLVGLLAPSPRDRG
jgi:hypothetical protein